MVKHRHEPVLFIAALGLEGEQHPQHQYEGQKGARNERNVREPVVDALSEGCMRVSGHHD